MKSRCCVAGAEASLFRWHPSRSPIRPPSCPAEATRNLHQDEPERLTRGLAPAPRRAARLRCAQQPRWDRVLLERKAADSHAAVDDKHLSEDIAGLRRAQPDCSG